MVKIELLLCMIQLKTAEITGNEYSQQQQREHMVGLHIKQQVAREQAHNRQLFTSI